MQESFINQVFHAIGLSAQVVAALIIAATTSAVYYLSKVKNGEEFKFLNFFVNIAVAMVMAFGAAAILGYMYSEGIDTNLEKFVMVFVGISGNKIMELVEKYGSRYLERKARTLSGNQD